MMKNDAGEFADWVGAFGDAMKGKGLGVVPCAACVACCTSSKFILVRPCDHEARSVIPEDVLFPAPGMPKGFHLMGYDERGHCPMFINGKCSIYHARPQTCRQYDCRALAATESYCDDEGEEIVSKARHWRFSFEDEKSVEIAAAIKRSMSFLQAHSGQFPGGYLPRGSAQLSALAIRVHSHFIDHESSRMTPREMAHAIVASYPVGDAAKVPPWV